MEWQRRSTRPHFRSSLMTSHIIQSSSVGTTSSLPFLSSRTEARVEGNECLDDERKKAEDSNVRSLVNEGLNWVMKEGFGCKVGSALITLIQVEKLQSLQRIFEKRLADVQHFQLFVC
mmetsp:Transcript_42544/g.51686  ORF Transcript_42544/g.51686 Transcript_42544/m.51686 type:complete len:118 (+) Transcript_42544:707-1060(+)